MATKRRIRLTILLMTAVLCVACTAQAGTNPFTIGNTLPPTEVPTPYVTAPPTPRPSVAVTPLPNTGGEVIFGMPTPTVTPYTQTQTVPPSVVQSERSCRRALMIYMIGSNLESKNSCATLDLDELQKAGIETAATKVFICAGGTKHWSKLDLGSGECAYYQLMSDGLKRLTSPRSISMGKAGTLTDFLQFCVQNSSADKYSLIFWDHAGGPIYGFGEDETHNDSGGNPDGLDMTEIYQALKSSPFGSGKKLEFIGFDACLMGNLEVAAMLAPFAEYMIASEESFPAYGWDYTSLGGGRLQNLSSLDLLKTVARESVAFYKSSSSNRPVILAVYNLSEVKNVATALDQVFRGSFVRSDYVAISRRVDSVRHVDKTDYDFDLYDLYGFALSIEADDSGKAANLKNALSRFIVSREYNQAASDFSGVSFYYPLSNKYSKIYSVNKYRMLSDLGLFGNYLKYMQGYVSTVRMAGAPLPLINRSVMSGIGSAESEVPELSANNVGITVTANHPFSRSEGVEFDVEVDPVLLNTFVRSYYLILLKTDAENYYLLEKGHGLKLTDDGHLKVVLSPEVRVIRGGDQQNWQYLPVTESGRNEDSLRYAAPLLYRQNSSVRLMNGLVIEDLSSPAGSLNSLSPVPENNMPMAVYEEPEVGSLITPIYEIRSYEKDSSGRPLPFEFWNPVGTGTVYGTEFRIDDNVRIDNYRIPAPDTVFVQICVEDVDGAVYASELKSLN